MRSAPKSPRRPWAGPNADEYVRRVCALVRKYRRTEYFPLEADQAAIDMVKALPEDATENAVADAIEIVLESYRVERQ
jgi:hypothetical protein